MKGLAPLFLGIFGTFAFSWVGLTVIPNWQIGHLNPESDEEGTDIYPRPQSGMFDRGEHVYAANGCVYCHSQQVRADYIADDIERKWGTRRSAPRDYIFDRPVFLGKMRMGQDLANIGARAPAPEESPSPAGGASPAGTPATQGAPVSSSPAEGAAKASPLPAQGASPAPVTSPAGSPATAPAASPGTSPAPAAQRAAVSSSPAEAAAKAGPPPSTTKSSVATAPAGALASQSPAAAGVAGASPATSPSPTAPPWPIQTAGLPPMYSAAWHHVHLYSPRSINLDSNMPAYRFLYEKRRIAGERSADALQLSGSDAPPEGWEVVPSYDAKCLVAYLMGLNQSHPLKDVRSIGGAPPPAASPAAAAQAASPNPAAAGSPAAAKK
jgi:cbb3-type cytochrome oxidase cytochrome c subunit